MLAFINSPSVVQIGGSILSVAKVRNVTVSAANTFQQEYRDLRDRPNSRAPV